MARLEDSTVAEPARRFTLLDAIVLVFVSALMLSADRVVRRLWTYEDQLPGLVPPTMLGWHLALMVPSVVLFPYQLTRRADRQRFRDGAPGLMVHLVVTMIVIVQLAQWVSTTLAVFSVSGSAGLDSIRWPVEVIDFLPGEARNFTGLTVATSWLTLATIGRWAPERAWDDRLGRIIGVLWIVFYFAVPWISLLE